MSFSFSNLNKSPATPKTKKASFHAQPSTTPSHPPPSSLLPSTTPLGPPPRSVYGSSFNTGNNTFGRKGNTPARKGFGFAVPDSSPPLQEADEEDDGYDDMDAPAEDDEMDDARGKDAFMDSIMSAPRGLKRSRNGQVREQVGGDYSSIARGMTIRAQAAQLSEPDDIMLRQEEILSRVEAGKDTAALAQGAADLTRLWAKHNEPATKEGSLGPESEDAFTRANYLSTLLLQLHLPNRLGANQAQSQNVHPSSALTRLPHNGCTIPRALLDWLNTYHNPFPDDFPGIRSHQPAPSAHERFWDSIYASLTRGKYQQAIHLLRSAGWENAWTAEEDSQPEGYSDKQLDNIEEVAERCARLLESSPAVKYDDWDVKGNDWTVYRARVRQAVRDLEAFNGDDEEGDEPQTRAGGNIFSISAASKKAASRVPPSIYENLKLGYEILLGSADQIIDASQDWLEATLYITIWWDGADGSADSAALRKSLSASQRPREADVAPATAYRRRLADAFAYVTDVEDPLFQPDTMDVVQVGLGCVMSDCVESVVAIVKMLSMPMSVAIVELAALSGWLPQPVGRPQSRGWVGQGLSSEDLMVLSHGPGTQIGNGSKNNGVDRDEILAAYADMLAQREVLRSEDRRTEREGWELAVMVLGRMDDEISSQQKITELLEEIELSDEARVDKILSACQGLDLVEQARAIAERYADSLATSHEDTTSQPAYGSALIYYARAHATEKLKDTLALLTSLCLLHSASIPAQADLDNSLASLLGAGDAGGRTALLTLARRDADAATLLAQYLSGYATLRRFYDLRDQNTLSASQPLARARDAAKALIAVLNSASDCIHGGLFDPEIESVVPIDGILVLLGEALPLLGQSKRVFTKEQVFTLLRILEDFEGVSGRIKENAESLLRASLNAHRSSTQPGRGGRDLKKSRSDLSKSSGTGSGLLGGSEWDLLAETVMVGSGGKSTNGSMLQVNRAWDWRKGLDKLGGVEVGRKEVVLLVRTALAQEVARGWTGQIMW
ncbi:hypothetical protein LTR78_007310 [Recurvomyces mirabilis]|uniref:Nuclear pore complex protein Nup85 n=1 Tax=Recurvomyces mirabilis TaxID=574656 RepID=A0AAE0WG58_9PEZI|nr:hypothetical protein LTR78_007310 [Recurvomyces mirabilis]KAK5155101.1 hypothetical protein LTS14_006056 [Recurvomyces mirabilis]